MLKRVLKFSLFVAAVGLVSGVGLADHSGQNGACTALHEAAFLDEPREVLDLLAHGVDVNCKDLFGHTALVTAVNGASLDSFGVLMDAGAAVNVKTEYGSSLLAYAQTKFRSVDQQKGLEQYRDLYEIMIARLQTAGAAN